MAFNRDDAKNSIVAQEQNDPELANTFGDANKTKTELEKIKNKHELDKLKAERGLVGCLFGDWKNVPMFIAILSFLGGLIVYILFINNAAIDTKNKELWAEAAKVAFTLATGAVGYIFGRGSKEEN